MEDLQSLFHVDEIENTITYEQRSIKCGSLSFNVHVISHHPLWAHYVYNSALELSKYLQLNPRLVSDKRVIEFGAGVGIPSLTALQLGSTVTTTDYPDKDLLKMLSMNFNHYENATVKGLLWGKLLKNDYDVALLADLVFNHSEQQKLLITLKSSLKPTGIALVSFTSHRPWLRKMDLQFFQFAADFGFKVELLSTIEGLQPVFPEDSIKDTCENDYNLRSSVDLYKLSIKI